MTGVSVRNSIHEKCPISAPFFPCIAFRPAKSSHKKGRTWRSNSSAVCAARATTTWPWSTSTGSKPIPLGWLVRHRASNGPAPCWPSREEQKDPAQRPPVFAAALAELEEFVRKNPTGPAGAQGRLEIARLAAYQGQALLTRALREEDAAIAKKAEQQFIQAGQELGAAVKVLAELAAGYKSSSKDKGDQVKQQLVQDLLQARFDRARNFVDQALTYIDTSSDADNRKRAEMIDQAKQAFKPIADDRGPVGLLASAWLVKVNQEGQDPTEAEKHRKRVMEQAGQAAQPAQRLAKLFYMQGVMKNPTIKLDPLKKYKLIEDKGKEWLASYPTQHNTLEGLAVRFELAQAMYQQAQALAKDAKGEPSAATTAILSQAQKHFTAIGESDSNLAEKAKGYNVNISVMKLGEGTTAADLKDFENCYLKAQVEIFKMRKVAAELASAAPKAQTRLEGERKQHLGEAVKALSRGIMLADAKTPPASLDEARYLLATGYLLAGDLYRAAVAGEALGRTRPPTKRAAQAAGHALECYATILQGDNAESNRQRLQELAEYIVSPEMQKSWAAEPVTAVARYQLAMLHNKDNAYKKAIAQLEKLPPDFSGYIYAQGQLVFIAQEAREKAKTEEEKKAFADVARKALNRIPNLPADADALLRRCISSPTSKWPSFIMPLDAAVSSGDEGAAQGGTSLQRNGKIHRRTEGQARQDARAVTGDPRQSGFFGGGDGQTCTLGPGGP